MNDNINDRGGRAWGNFLNRKNRLESPDDFELVMQRDAYVSCRHHAEHDDVGAASGHAA